MDKSEAQCIMTVALVLSKMRSVDLCIYKLCFCSFKPIYFAWYQVKVSGHYSFSWSLNPQKKGKHRLGEVELCHTQCWTWRWQRCEDAATAVSSPSRGWSQAPGQLCTLCTFAACKICMSHSSPQSYKVKTEETSNKLDLSSNYGQSSGHSLTWM